MKKSHNWTARIHFSKTWLQPYQSCSIFPNCSSPRLFHITPMLRVHRIIPYSSSAFLGCSYSPLYSTVRVPYVFWQCAWCLYTFHLSFPGIRLYISHWVSLCRIWLFDLMLRNRLDSTFHIQILIMLPTVQYTRFHLQMGLFHIPERFIPWAVLFTKRTHAQRFTFFKRYQCEMAPRVMKSRLDLNHPFFLLLTWTLDLWILQFHSILHCQSNSYRIAICRGGIPLILLALFTNHML